MTDQTTQSGENWFGDLSDAPELNEWVTNKGYENPKSALESAFNLEKLLGADKAGRTIVLPKDDKDEEGMKAFRAKLGVPDAPDGYELPVPEGDSEEFAKTAAAWFHEAGVPKAAAAKIAENWNKYFGELVQKQQQEDTLRSEKALNDLRSEWGDSFDERSEHGRRGFKILGVKAGLDENDLNAVEQSLGTAKMLKLFHQIGETMKESDFAGGDGGNRFSMTPAEAQQRLDDARKKRLAGDITEAQFMEAQDKYGLIASKAA